MLGRLEGKRAMLLLAAAAAACLLALAPAGGARGPSLSALKAENAALESQSRAAVLDLYSLDARLAFARDRLAGLQATATRLAAERAALTQELRLAKLDTRVSQKRLALRLRYLYEHGRTTSLDVLMGATSLQDALAQLDDFNRVTQANVAVLVQVQTARRHLRTVGRTIGARSHALAATMADAARTVAQLEQLQAERSAYVASLASRRSLNAAKIDQLTAEARAAAVKARVLVAPRAETVAALTTPATVGAGTPPPASTPEPVPGARTLTVVATAYDLPGHTSTGLPVGWGVAAVDPSVIPLGTRFVVPGYGVAVAADTGGSIVGATIDLWFPSASRAYAWGRRTVTISFED